MNISNPFRIRNIADSYRDYSARLLSKLIRIPSLSGKEERIVRFLEREFSRCGADEVQIDDFGNIIVRLGSKGPVIAFDGHLDTVDVGRRNLWNKDPFSGEIRDSRVYGRGATDQKGGITAMITALRILRDLSTDLPFTLFFVASVQEEECEGLCWQHVIEKDKVNPDIVILTEPTGGKISRGQRGRMEMEITVEGVSCHGSAPELGENAIYKAAPIISALKKLNQTLSTDPFLGRGTLVVTRLRSNSPSLNAIADFAAIYLDRRLTAGETPESAKAQVESIKDVQIAGAKVHIPSHEIPSWRGTIYPTSKVFPAWSLPESHHLIEYAVRCHKQLFDTAPKIDKWVFSTNGVATKGIYDIPTFGYGPGEERMAHAPNESVAIDDLTRAAAFYAFFPWILTGA